MASATTRARRGPVTMATVRELDALRKTAPQIADSALAASAVVMARQLDDPDTSSTSKSMCQARLQEAMTTLHALAPARREPDGLDDIARAREARLARLVAAQDPTGS